MRVLALVDSLSFGGAEHLLGTVGRHAPAAGLTVEVASIAPRGPDARRLEAHLAAHHTTVTYLDIPRLATPAAVPRVAAAIRSGGHDVVHSHMEYAATLGPVAGALTGRPVVTTFHHVPGPLAGRDRLRERLAVATASRGAAVLFVSHAAHRAFAARYRPRPNWSVLHNGVSLDTFTPGDGPLPPDLAHPGPTVTIVAALRRAKGHAEAITAWPTVRRAVPDARLLIVGHGSEERCLRAQVDEAGLSEAVTFAGPRTDVPAILRGSTLALSPSHTEALPTALIEAAACGVPTVATDVGGTAEVVLDGRTGLLVPPRDPAALAAAVIALLGDPHRRRAMGAAARAHAEASFDGRRWVAALADTYHAVAGRRRRRRALGTRAGVGR